MAALPQDSLPAEYRTTNRHRPNIHDNLEKNGKVTVPIPLPPQPTKQNDLHMVCAFIDNLSCFIQRVYESWCGKREPQEIPWLIDVNVMIEFLRWLKLVSRE